MLSQVKTCLDSAGVKLASPAAGQGVLLPLVPPRKPPYQGTIKMNGVNNRNRLSH